MNVWNDDSNCGTVSPTCPELPCGQNCLYKVNTFSQGDILIAFVISLFVIPFRKVST